MQPNLTEAFALLEDEMRRWTTPDETNVFCVRPESLLDVAVAAGSVEGRRLNDGRIAFTLAGRVCRAYRGTISIRTFLAGLAHRIEGLNYPEPNQEGVFRVCPYGFEAEVNYPLREKKPVCLYVETCNGHPKIAQVQAFCFFIMRRDFHEAEPPDWSQASRLPQGEGDAYFSDAQQARLQELKRRRDTLTADEYAELEGLIEAALDATIARTKSLMLAKA